MAPPIEPDGSGGADGVENDAPGQPVAPKVIAPADEGTASRSTVHPVEPVKRRPHRGHPQHDPGSGGAKRTGVPDPADTSETTAAVNSDDSAQAEPRLVYRLEPYQQANLLGFFSLATSALFIGASAALEPRQLPPYQYYIATLTVWTLCWWSFAFRHLPKVFALFRWLGDLLTVTSTGKRSGPRLSDIFNPEAREVGPREKYPLPDAVRVQLLAVATITLSAWLTVYSGGPFESPYSQILLALALLAPNVAYSAWSIVLAYLVTATASAAFHYGFEARRAPESNWYVATTGLVLLLSCWIAFVTRKNQIATPPTPSAAAKDS